MHGVTGVTFLRITCACQNSKPQPCRVNHGKIQGKAPRLPEISYFLTILEPPIRSRGTVQKTMSDKMLEKDDAIIPPSYDAAANQHGALPSRNGPSERRGTLLRGPFYLDIPVLNQLRGKRCILASQSPRRKQILAPVTFPHPLSSLAKADLFSLD
jgi:hypothetical protein